MLNIFWGKYTKKGRLKSHAGKFKTKEGRFREIVPK
jgi:hypothetical protein